MIISSVGDLKLILGGTVVMAGVIAAIRPFAKRYTNTHIIPPDASDSSAIIAYYTAGHGLINVGTGVVDGMHYSMYLTTPAESKFGESFVQGSAVVYVLDLPFNTQVHLLGLSKAYALDRLRFESFLTANAMQKIQLEGDFPDHFDLYADTDQDLQVRYVLDPDAMTTVEIYCQNHFWELHDSELYFVVTNNSIGDVDFIIESQQFVAAIRPALPASDPNAPIVHHEVPYDIYDGPALMCPICRKQMELHDSKWFRCPEGHGVLVTGDELDHLARGELHIEADITKAVHHGPLTCPHCGSAMELVHYQAGPVEINSCPICPFRWLDPPEIIRLGTHKRRLWGLQ